MNNYDEHLLRTDYLKILLEYYYPVHFFALFRAHELYNIEPFIELLRPPILDLGCGDGFISHLLFGKQLNYGIDPSEDAVARAVERKAYNQTFLGNAHNIPLESNSLGGIFSNCTLEHIPQSNTLIKEIARVLRPNAYFIATALSPFYYTLNPAFRAFDRRGGRWLRKRMIREENSLHNHVSVFSPGAYSAMFMENGMRLEAHSYYGTEKIADFCTLWDTTSKYAIPYPLFLTHGGILTKWLVLRYGKKPKGHQLDLWRSRFYKLCYQRNESAKTGIGQILIARKLNVKPA